MRNPLRLLLWMLCALPLGAPAQLLPPVPPVNVPVPLRLPPATQPLTDLPSVMVGTVRSQTRSLLRRYPDRVERDPRGAPVVRAVLIALSPDPAALTRAQQRGYVIQDDRTLPVLEQRVVTLVIPAGRGTDEALRELRTDDPAGSYDFDHLYVESGAAPAVQDLAAASTPVASAGARIRIGLIDGGVDGAHPVFRHAPPQLSGCGGTLFPSSHGTAVASLLVGSSPVFSGAAPDAQLLAVDVYCGDSGPGGRMRDIVAGLAELAGAGVRVINLSVVGPDNAVLAAVVRALLARSILLVAAAGNDGPNAPPLFPAAYPGVIAVTAVDGRARALAEAAGGAHISFAAPGAEMLAAAPGGQYATVRGTSFAAPLVAGLFARALSRDGGLDAAALIQQLVATAEDRGKKGRDRRYGYGLVGADLRVEPRSLAGRANK